MDMADEAIEPRAGPTLIAEDARQSLSQEIATRHSSHGGEFGERIDAFKDAEHRVVGQFE